MRNGEATGREKKQSHLFQPTFWEPPLFAGLLQEPETFFCRSMLLFEFERARQSFLSSQGARSASSIGSAAALSLLFASNPVVEKVLRRSTRSPRGKNARKRKNNEDRV